MFIWSNCHTLTLVNYFFISLWHLGHCQQVCDYCSPSLLPLTQFNLWGHQNSMVCHILSWTFNAMSRHYRHNLYGVSHEAWNLIFHCITNLVWKLFTKRSAEHENFTPFGGQFTRVSWILCENIRLLDMKYLFDTARLIIKGEAHTRFF